MQLRKFLPATSHYIVLTLALILNTAARADEPKPASGGDKDLSRETLVYVGTFTRNNSKGIYLFRLQTKDLEVSQNITLVPLGLAAETISPTFLELEPKRNLLFAVNEVNEYQGQPSGAVSSFSIDRKTGQLTLINKQPSKGKGPCHLVLDKTGKNLLVANYAGGSVAVLPVAADGTLGEASEFIQHEGKASSRSRKPHAHCTALDAANKFAFVCDLGCDKVFTYKFDAEHGKLTPAETPFTELKPGSGPRHMVFRPDGKFAYVINELSSTVTAFSYDPEKGTLTELQTISTLPPYYDGSNSCAEIDMHPSGKWLYASNRGHNSVILFSIDSDSGMLTYIEEQGTGGKTPRNFGIEPSAKHLAIANQDSNTILVCRIDAENGRLKPSGVFADAPSPVCVKFLPPAGAAK